MRSSLIFGAAPLLLCAAQGQESAPTSDDGSERPAVLQRVYVAGASVSDGFGLPAELKAPAKLSHLFEAACSAEGASFTPLGDSRFFLDPKGAGERIIDSAIEGGVSCFIGVDFLFWYAYGMKPEARRLQHLDAALKELERLECHLLIGDMPDMSIALEGRYFGRPLITQEMIPTEETLAALDVRLKEWVKTRDNATIIPLSVMLEQIQSGKEITMRGVRYEPKELPDLLQSDYLHLTAEGSMALCLLVGDLLVSGQESITPTDFVFDRAAAMGRLDEIAARLREAEAASREARREERRRAREERRKKRDEEEAEEQRAPHELRAAS